MKRHNVNKEVIKRAAVRSARESAQLERRVIPAGYVRSEKTERYLAERRQQV